MLEGKQRRKEVTLSVFLFFSSIETSLLGKMALREMKWTMKDTAIAPTMYLTEVIVTDTYVTFQKQMAMDHCPSLPLLLLIS